MNLVDFQNTITYEIIRNILAAVFYILVILYAYYKIYNIIYVIKLNCKEEYKVKKNEIQKELKDNKGKILKKIILIFGILVALLIGITLFLVFFNIVILIFSGFGLGVFLGDNLITNFLKKFMEKSAEFLLNRPALALYGFTLLFYIIVYVLLIRGIYVNRQLNESLKEK